MNKWNIDQVPSQPGKIAVVTGANNGIGYETTLGLVKKDIEVIMMSPYKVTLDGFENQLATNYLGHFALTGLLLPLLTTTSGSRIVTLSSLSYKWAKIQFADLHARKNYSPSKAYGQSKRACLM